MRKFAIFTVILSAIIIVVVAEIVMTEYWPSFRESFSEETSELTLTLPEGLDFDNVMETNVLRDGLTNHLGSDLPNSSEENVELLGDSDFLTEDDLFFNDDLPLDENFVNEEVVLSDNIIYDPATFTGEMPSIYEDNYSTPGASTDIYDFEDAGSTIYSPNVYLREDQVRSAGFSQAYLEEEIANGLLFKTIYVDDLYDVELKKIAIRTEDSLLAKVYILTFGMNAGIDEVYEVLKVRASEGIDSEINVTNSYGDESFFMNDSRRQGTAFLTVKIGPAVYAFSYPKEYHSQIENLVKLIDLEL